MSDAGQRLPGTMEIQNAVKLANSAMLRGDVEGANAIAAPLLDAGAEDPFLLKVRALWLHNAGHFRDALRTFHHARTLTPQDAMIANGIAGCLAGLGQFDAALKMADTALALAPNAPPIHYMRAWVLENARNYEAARTAYESVIALSPRHAAALAGLASVCARLGDYAAARKHAGEALQVTQFQPTASLALATTDIAEGNPDAAAARMEELGQHASQLPPPARALRLGTLGDARDAQGRYDEAFSAYRAKNTELKTQFAAAMRDLPSMTDQISAISDRLDATAISQWTQPSTTEAAGDEPAAHVFLLGFPRSGSTLLARVLAANSDVTSLDERGTLRSLADTYLANPAGIDQLATLGDLAVIEARKAYWQKVRELGVEPAGKVFIDKDPLNTVSLPLIAKFFPTAKVVFAIRDPRDVLLSCYRRLFAIDPVNFELLDIESGARFYSEAMRLAATCRTSLPLSIKDCRYESLIGDFEETVRSVCAFLHIEWNDEVQEIAKHMQAEDRAGHWKHYRSHLDAAMPTLAPWIEKFGYPES